jgi:hypothetical protein
MKSDNYMQAKITLIKKPETIKEITDFLSIAIEKAMSLNASSFGKFTADHLSDDYFFNKWIGKKKDFADVYLNMDNDNQQLFIKYAVGQASEHSFFLSQILRRFFNFCFNFHSSDFTENPFTGKYGIQLTKAATGKKNPAWITSSQVQKLFHKLDDDGKQYLTWCVFGVKN